MRIVDLTAVEDEVVNRTGYMVRGNDKYLLLANGDLVNGNATMAEIAFYSELAVIFLSDNGWNPMSDRPTKNYAMGKIEVWYPRDETAMAAKFSYNNFFDMNGHFAEPEATHWRVIVPPGKGF